MKICITSQGNSMDARVDPRFGRCPYFMIIDTETSEIEAVQNPNMTGMGGIGVQSGQFMSEKKVKTVITGNVGPNASRTLQAADIEVITGVSGSIREVVEEYKRGGMKSSGDPTVGSKSGKV